MQKEIPILFSTDMVRCIALHLKKRTRRIVPRISAGGKFEWGYTCFTPPGHISMRGYFMVDGEQRYGEKFIKLPYCKGDLLWVREEHRIWIEEDYVCCEYKDGSRMDIDKGSLDDKTYDRLLKRKTLGNWQRARFLPKAFSRIWLQVDGDIQVERVSDITEPEVKLEGFACCTKDGALYKYGIPDKDGLPGGVNDNSGWAWSEWETDAITAFKKLWDKINGAPSWERGDWVFVAPFKPISFNGKPIGI